MQIELKIPQQIYRLVEKGIWPKSSDEANHQHTKSLVPKDKLKEFAPDEDWIYFYPMPFKKISDTLLDEGNFWNQWGAINQINPELTFIIADFGIGSDTCLILDYRENIDTPSLYRLVRNNRDKDGNYWEKVSNNFGEFCAITELNKLLL